MSSTTEHEAQISIDDKQLRRAIARAGGDKLKVCKTCDHCSGECFIGEHFPQRPAATIPRDLLDGNIHALLESDMLWACTLCGRCTVECPEDLKMDDIVRTIRGFTVGNGHMPKRLRDGLDKIKSTGNSIGMDSEEFVDTLEWLAEEAAEDIPGVDEDDVSVPIDKEGAEFLYIPNPREYTSTPHMFTAYFRFFLATGTDMTYASDLCDISNWAYFLGDDETAGHLAEKIFQTAQRLGVKAVLTTECGHGLSILRTDIERLTGRRPDIEVISIVELAHKLFKEGTLKLKKGAVEQSVTYHDPCEVGRKLGITDPPRELLTYISRDYREMTPDPRKSTCCGGGGGVVQNSDLGKKRLEFAKTKHDLIADTGAEIVATSCQACLAQLKDTCEHYGMPVKAMSVIELVVDALE